MYDTDPKPYGYNNVVNLIREERTRQHALWDRQHEWGWGDCSSRTVDPPTKLAVLLEEVGEVARALLENNQEQLRRELVQVAAVAVAWLESYDRT